MTRTEVLPTAKAWHLLPHLPTEMERLGGAFGIPPIVAQLLLNRGLEEADAAQRFLSMPFAGLRDPASLPGAAEAVLDVCGRPAGELTFSSVIEEECTGNGMLAVLAAGHDAAGTLIGEPSGLALMHAGVGVIWARLTARSGGAHPAFSVGGSSSASVIAALEALRGLEDRLNDPAGLAGLSANAARNLSPVTVRITRQLL